MKFKSFLLASTVALLAVTGAKAADAIIAEEPVPVLMAPSFSWDGGYVGGQIGYGWGRSTFRTDEDSLRLKPDGFLGGLYAGYNFDVGNNVILGVDGDVTYNNLKDSVTETDDIFGEDGVESKLRWSGAVRARAGVAVDRFLPYLAGGVAFGNVKNSFYSTEDGNYSQSKSMTGWTLGGGVDYAATDNVILRLEYRYTDYGRKDFNPASADFDFGARNRFKTHDIRLGVAYKF